MNLNCILLLHACFFSVQLQLTYFYHILPLIAQRCKKLHQTWRGARVCVRQKKSLTLFTRGLFSTIISALLHFNWLLRHSDDCSARLNAPFQAARRISISTLGTFSQWKTAARFSCVLCQETNSQLLAREAEKESENDNEEEKSLARAHSNKKHSWYQSAIAFQLQ